MCTRESADFSNALRTVAVVEANHLVPLGLVADEVDLDSDLTALRVTLHIDDSSWQPFAHLVEHINTTVQLEAHTTAPLLLDTHCRSVVNWNRADPLIVLGCVARVVHKNTLLFVLDL